MRAQIAFFPRAAPRRRGSGWGASWPAGPGTHHVMSHDRGPPAPTVSKGLKALVTVRYTGGSVAALWQQLYGSRFKFKQRTVISPISAAVTRNGGRQTYSLRLPVDTWVIRLGNDVAIFASR